MPQRAFSTTSTKDIELFVTPSKETMLIAKRLPWLFRKYEGEESTSAQWLQARAMSFIVAPMTQFSLFSFDLNVHLFLVLHTSLSAQISHFLMIPVNFFFMVFAAHAFSLLLGGAPGDFTSNPAANGATIYAGVTALWYNLVAINEGLHLWGLISLGLVWAVWTVAATALAAGVWYTEPFYAAILCFLCCLGIGIGHIGEEHCPPRFNFTHRWVDNLTFAKHNPFHYFVVGAMSGSYSEMAASARLMPYNHLIVMFKLGYQPEKWAVLKDRADRAWKSGNPALDYVGVGGGAVLDFSSFCEQHRGMPKLESNARTLHGRG